MPIDTPRGLSFSVDTWGASSKRKRHHFLTHAHKDHLSGIVAFSSHTIYSTRLTKSLVLCQFPQLDDSLLLEIEVGQSVVINDPDGDFKVTAFDANHCPGAAMFLFEGDFGNILHTGDCRLNLDCMQDLPLKFINKKGKDCQLDYLFLDCTFGRCPIKFPSKQLAIRQVMNCIWKHPYAPVVYLACDLLGQEDILIEVSKTFGSKIYVDKIKNPGIFHALSLVAPEILSKDGSSRFQLIEGFGKLNEMASKQIAKARAYFEPEPIFIRPSAQWYATVDQVEKVGLKEAVRDEFGVWHVCYSIHSSREELDWALQLLQPKWVISTTPPCRAMELNYVKEHCYKTCIRPDDPIWKLFKSGSGNSLSSSIPTTLEASRKADVRTSEVLEFSMECSITGVKELASDRKLDSSPSSLSKPVTLFGRARLGDKFINLLKGEKKQCLESINYMSDLSLQKVLDSVNGEKNIIDSPEAILQADSTANKMLSPLQNSGLFKLCTRKSVHYAKHRHNDITLLCEESARIGDGKREDACDLSMISEVTEQNTGKSKDENTSCERNLSYIGSSKRMNASLRRVYRSMNVPVPRPLPSLLELMRSRKRVYSGACNV